MSRPSRYGGACLTPLIDWFDEPDAVGVTVCLVAPGQAADVAAALRHARPAADIREADWPDVTVGPPAKVVVCGLPLDRAAAISAVAGRLNDFRDRMHSLRHALLFLLTREEARLMGSYARDVWSLHSELPPIAFEPRAGVRLGPARAELEAAQREAFGRLDLRGLYRVESEDRGWDIGAVYQDLRVAPLGSAASLPAVELVRARGRGDAPRLLLLGAPGSGKSFFLRWRAIGGGPADEGRRLRILVPLGAYLTAAGPLTLRDFIREHLLRIAPKAADVFDAQLRRNGVELLLDGLDEGGTPALRAGCANAVEQLAAEAPGCTVIVASRPTGVPDGRLAGFERVEVQPFADGQIGGFLTAWCGLYAQELHGRDKASERRGREEGARLAAEIRGNPQVRELARNPLMLTILAIVHRAGTRLPDHRIELYEHAARVLVERWNRARSLGSATPAPALRMVDALKLLGPAALHMIEQGRRVALERETLLGLLRGALADSVVKGIASAEEALALFKDTLGLVIEVAPERFQFAHLTFTEYFAARELLRTHRMDEVLAEPNRAFADEWREVLRLAFGQAGLIDGDELEVRRWLERAMALPAEGPKAAAGKGMLLLGVLTDDPGLRPAEIVRGLEAAVAASWGAGERLWELLFTAIPPVSRVAEAADSDLRARLAALFPPKPELAPFGENPVAVSQYLQLLRGVGFRAHVFVEHVMALASEPVARNFAVFFSFGKPPQPIVILADAAVLAAARQRFPEFVVRAHWFSGGQTQSQEFPLDACTVETRGDTVLITAPATWPADSRLGTVTLTPV